MKRRCVSCGKLTEKWQRINGGYWHCYDGCLSTTGYDQRKLVSRNGQVSSARTLTDLREEMRSKARGESA